MLRRVNLASVTTVFALFALADILRAQTLLGPSPYLQASNSPFSGLSGFTVDNLEDNALNIAGVSADSGSVLGPGSLTDSVDGDDGVIDGFGNNGHSFIGSGSTGITFTFNAALIGFVPKSAGIVWTDADNPIAFEAFDTMGASLGTLIGNHADGSSSGTTAEDRFYGVSFAGGIGSIRISSGPFGMELDHVQYAAAEVLRFPGDFNGDLKVDAADYVAWRKTDGTPAGYNEWRSHFGLSFGSGSAASAAVPEPTTLTLVLLNSLCLACRHAGRI
jgi:hypothetical protein